MLKCGSERNCCDLSERDKVYYSVLSGMEPVWRVRELCGNLSLAYTKGTSCMILMVQDRAVKKGVSGKKMEKNGCGIV